MTLATPSVSKWDNAGITVAHWFLLADREDLAADAHGYLFKIAD